MHQSEGKKNFKCIFVAIATIILVVVVGIIALCCTHESSSIQHTITFTDKVPSECQDILNQYLSNISLGNDIIIDFNTSNHLEDEFNQVLYDIYVPVTDFYDGATSISAEEAETVTFIPITELTNQHRLLAIDDEYYLDTLSSGAKFEYMLVQGNEEDVVKITTLIKEHLPEFPTKETILSIAQTGVTALARHMTEKLNQVGNTEYFAQNIKAYLSSFDLTHTSNEASFSDQANSTNICSRPEMFTVLEDIGIDIIELTGNHNQDCGDEDALATISTYQNASIQIVGGGVNAEAAATPLKIDQKNTTITLLGYNLSTGGYTLDDTPGANFYTTEKVTSDISAAKAQGDFVIVDIQYFECNAYDVEYESDTCDYANSSDGDQIGLFREVIDLGADIVTGTSAHQPQTFEKYHNGTIYYGLGNLFFDQSWWPGTTRSLILAHYFWDGRLIQTRIVPTVYDESLQTSLMDATTATWFINRLVNARPTDGDN